MKEDIIANESEWVKYLPKSFKIANHTFKVVQYNELFSDDDFIWGCFCYADLEICIRIKNDGKEVSEEIIRNTFYHELFCNHWGFSKDNFFYFLYILYNNFL